MASKIQNLKDLEKKEDIGQYEVDTVVVTQNNMTIYPEALLSCRNTRFLHASINKLVIIPSLGKYKHLTVCDLSNNRITAFPVGVIACRGLKILDVSGNRLKCLSLKLSECTKLRVVRASDNFIEEFPAVLFDLKLIDTISLRNNLIKVLPARIGTLRCLRVLLMQQNKLMTIPFSIVNTSIGEPGGKLRLDMNNLVPTLRDCYLAYGTQGLLDMITNSEPKELFRILEKELKEMATKMMSLQKTKTLKKKKDYDLLKNKKIRNLLKTQKTNLLLSQSSGDLFSDPLPPSPESQLSIKITSKSDLHHRSMDDMHQEETDGEYAIEIRNVPEILKKRKESVVNQRVSMLAPLSPITTNRRRSKSENNALFSGPLVYDSSDEENIDGIKSSGNSPLKLIQDAETIQIESNTESNMIKIRQSDIFDAARDLGLLFENIYQQLEDEPRISRKVDPIRSRLSNRISIYSGKFLQAIEDLAIQSPAIEEDLTQHRQSMVIKQSRLKVETWQGSQIKRENSTQSDLTDLTVRANASEQVTPITLSRNTELITSRKLVNKRLELDDEISPRKSFSTRSVLANNFEEMMRSKENISQYANDITIGRKDMQDNASLLSDATFLPNNMDDINRATVISESPTEINTPSDFPITPKSSVRKTFGSFIVKSPSKPNLSMTIKDIKEDDLAFRRSRSHTFTQKKKNTDTTDERVKTRFKSFFKSNSKEFKNNQIAKTSNTSKK